VTQQLTLPLDTLAFIIQKAREFDVQVEVDDPDPGSNPSDDRQLGVLEDTGSNPAEIELAQILSDLNNDQLAELLALLWVGRGDYTRIDWHEAVRTARAAKNQNIIHYFLGTPMLGDLVEEGLAELGLSVPLPQEEVSP
jgi:hypothetical protein